MFFSDSFFGYDCFDGVDRRDWRDKSDAAIRRENQAKSLFDAFVERCKESPSFPVTQEVVPPSTHLTDACWKTFKQYVVSKGCTAKRREANQQERIASKETRRGKLYFISITVPVHPSKAVEESKLKKEKAAAAALAKKQKAAATAERKALAAKQLKIKIEQEYAAVVAGIKMQEDSYNTNQSPTSAMDHPIEDQPEPVQKKRKIAAEAITLTAPKEALLGHAETQFAARKAQIMNQIHHEKTLESRKKEAMVQAALAERDTIKQTIVDLIGGASAGN